MQASFSVFFGFLDFSYPEIQKHATVIFRSFDFFFQEFKTKRKRYLIFWCFTILVFFWNFRILEFHIFSKRKCSFLNFYIFEFLEFPLFIPRLKKSAGVVFSGFLIFWIFQNCDFFKLLKLLLIIYLSYSKIQNNANVFFGSFGFLNFLNFFLRDSKNANVVFLIFCFWILWILKCARWCFHNFDFLTFLNFLLFRNSTNANFLFFGFPSFRFFFFSKIQKQTFFFEFQNVCSLLDFRICFFFLNIKISASVLFGFWDCWRCWLFVFFSSKNLKNAGVVFCCFPPCFFLTQKIKGCYSLNF